MKFLRKNLPFLVIFLISLLSISSLFHPGFFEIHDDTQVARVYEIGKALRDGMFPVRWVSDLGYGYGYPIFNFYAPLAYYFGGIVNLLGFDPLTSTKIMMGLGIILSGIFMYLLAKEFWGKLGGVVSALFYVFAPYHAVEVFVRGDVGEFWAYAFMPLMFWGFYRLYKNFQENVGLAQNNSKFKIQNSKVPYNIKNTWVWVTIGSIGYAGMILSHNLTAMMVTPFLVMLILFFAYKFYKAKKVLSIYYLVFTAVLGLLIAAFYWIPALFEMQYTNVLSQIGGGADFKDHFVCLNQLWSSPWGFGGSTKGCIDGMSFQIGKLHIILAVFPFFFLFSKKKGNFYPLLFGFLLFIFSIFLLLDMSSFFWELIPQMKFFQFPWRFLIIISFASSFLAGSFIWFTSSYLKSIYLKYFISFVIITLLLISNIKFFSPQRYLYINSRDYTGDFSLKWKTSKISDEYMPKNFRKPFSYEEIPKNKIEGQNAKILSLKSKTQEIIGEINASDKALVTVNLAYFPSFKFYIEGKIIEPKFSGDSYKILFPLGEHSLRIVFHQTSIEKISDFLSLAGIIILLLGIIYPRKKYLNEEKNS